jgi:hypothetical protein
MSGDGVTLTRMRLRITRFLLVGGYEFSWQVDAPHCRRCVATANKAAPNGATYVISYLGFALFWALAAGVPAIKMGVDWTLAKAFWSGLALALPSMCVWYAVVRRPWGRKTSTWQAISVADYGLDANRKHVIRALRFANDGYARLVLERNPGTQLLPQ